MQVALTKINQSPLRRLGHVLVSIELRPHVKLPAPNVFERAAPSVRSLAAGTTTTTPRWPQIAPFSSSRFRCGAAAAASGVLATTDTGMSWGSLGSAAIAMAMVVARGPWPVSRDRAVPGFCVGVCGSRRSVASAVHTTAEKSWRFAVPQLATLPSRHCIGVFFSRVRVISKSKATVQVRGRTYGALSCSCATETSP
jgi:hypothetical protein